MKTDFTSLTISRQFGTGGIRFGLELSKELGIPLVHQELLTHLATEMGTSEEMLENYETMRDTSRRYVLQTLVSRYSFASRDIIMSKKYIEATRQVMRRLTALGPVIIVGHGGQCILHDQPGVLHLRIVAEESFKLAHLAALPQYACDSQKQMEKLFREHDASRSHFTRHHFGREIDDPTLYHLVINFSMLAPERARLVIARLLGR